MAQTTIRAPASSAATAAQRDSFAERMRQSPIAQVLTLPDFRWIWLGSFASFTAMNMQMITQSWLVLRLEDGSPSALTWAMVSFAAPMALVSLLGGALSDRVPKKHLIIASQLGNAALTFVVGMLDASGIIWLGGVMILGVLNGSMFAINMPSRQSIISEIVPRDRVMNAVALNNASMNVTRAFGPALAGILIAYLSTAVVFYIVAAVYVFSALSVVRLKSTVVAPAAARKGVLGDIKEGMRYALGDPTLRGLIIMAFIPARIRLHALCAYAGMGKRNVAGNLIRARLPNGGDGHQRAGRHDRSCVNAKPQRAGNDTAGHQQRLGANRRRVGVLDGVLHGGILPACIRAAQLAVHVAEYDAVADIRRA